MTEDDVKFEATILTVGIQEKDMLGAFINPAMIEMSDSEGHHIVPSILVDLMARNEAFARIMMEAYHLFGKFLDKQASAPKMLLDVKPTKIKS